MFQKLYSTSKEGVDLFMLFKNNKGNIPLVLIVGAILLPASFFITTSAMNEFKYITNQMNFLQYRLDQESVKDYMIDRFILALENQTILLSEPSKMDAFKRFPSYGVLDIDSFFSDVEGTEFKELFELNQVEIIKDESEIPNCITLEDIESFPAMINSTEPVTFVLFVKKGAYEGKIKITATLNYTLQLNSPSSCVFTHTYFNEISFRTI